MKRFATHPLLLIVLVATMLVGCRSSKGIGGGEDLVGASVAKRYDALAASSADWSQINVPVRVDIRQPMSLSASGRAYMRRGEDIYISLRVLGFEVATIYANNDSVFAADKINRRYIAEPIASVLGSFNVTIADIQDIIIGRAFILGHGTVSTRNRNDVALSEGDGFWTITPRRAPSGVKYSFDISDTDNALQALNVSYHDRSATVNYSGPESTDCGTFLSQARIATQLKGKPFDAGIRLTWGSVKYTVDPSVRWRTPNGYTRLDARSILKILSNN